MPRRSTPKVAAGERVVETVDIPVPNEGRTITFIRPIDGDLRHSYERTLPTERERRQELDALETTCISCAKTVSRADIKVCARCKGPAVHGQARYCSKECQIQHWKVHKADCGQSGSPLPRLIERALADRFISFHLSLGIINLLGLTQSPRTREHTNAKTSESIVCLTFELDFADIQELITRLSEIEFPPDVHQ
ncbi:MYND finger protein [Mycena sanguinolenta]|uniref:MYND finger protein n=1 Tax=Mycena sanguinolenta TaxID=230812 RepID=A0A8H6XLZ0_9AGAR|nr:MYND finger protein [Mycena sanguinolenta]